MFKNGWLRRLQWKEAKMKFKLSDNFEVDSSKFPWNVEGLRVGFFGMPGSGKGHTCAILIEQFLEQGGTVVIFEPRYEWETLKEKFPVQVAGGPYADVPLVPSQYRLYAEAVAKNGISIIFNTGDLEEEELVNFAEGFIKWVLKLEETIRRPIMLVIEESQEYCPKTAEGHILPPWTYKRMIKQFKDCFTQGRKLNVNPVIITQRPQELNFSIRMLCNISFFGKFAPQDIGYIERECLKPYRERGIHVRSDVLLDLPLGEWLVIHGGKAERVSVTEQRKTPHGAITPKLEYVAPVSSEVKKTVTDLSKLLMQAIEKEKAEEAEAEKLKRKISDLESKLKQKEQEISELNIALRVKGSQPPEKIVEKVGVDPEDVKRFVKDLRDGLLETFDKVAERFLGKEETVKPSGALNDDIVKMWLNKLPTPCAKKIFTFLAEHRGVKFTKSQIALQTAYSTNSGTFNSALSLLKRNNLVKTDGESWWFE